MHLGSQSSTEDLISLLGQEEGVNLNRLCYNINVDCDRYHQISYTVIYAVWFREECKSENPTDE